MNCKQVREEFFNPAGSPAVDEHLRACAACANELAALRRTMTLLDEWQAPEPSPYFDARLRARLREEALAPRTWREWLRDAVSPFTAIGRGAALVATMGVLLAAGVTLFQGTHEVRVDLPNTPTIAAAATGTAVGDLQALDKNQELLTDFDLLDDDVAQ